MGLWNRYYPDVLSYTIHDSHQRLSKSSGNYYIRNTILKGFGTCAVSLNRNVNYTTLVAETIFSNLAANQGPLAIYQAGGQCVIYHTCSKYITTSKEMISHFALIFSKDERKKSYYIESSASSLTGYWEHNRFDNGKIIINKVNLSNCHTTADNSILLITPDPGVTAKVSFCNFVSMNTDGYDGLTLYYNSLNVQGCIFSDCKITQLGLFGTEKGCKSYTVNNVIIKKCKYQYIVYNKYGTTYITNCRIIDSSRTDTYGGCQIKTTNVINFNGKFLFTTRCLGKYLTVTEPIRYNPTPLYEVIFYVTIYFEFD